MYVNTDRGIYRRKKISLVECFHFLISAGGRGIIKDKGLVDEILRFASFAYFSSFAMFANKDDSVCARYEK